MGLTNLKRRLKGVAEPPQLKKEWKTVRGGAIANEFNLPGLQDDEALQVKRLLDQGRLVLTYRTIQLRLDIGRVATKLKDLLGTDRFWKTVGEYWFDGDVDVNQRRRLELAMQMYRFSLKDGKYIPKDIPLDSYIQIMRESGSKKNDKDRRKFTKKIVRTQKFNGIDLTQTKKIRMERKKMHKAVMERGDDSLKEKLLSDDTKALVSFISMQVSTINTKMLGFKKQYGIKGLQKIFEGEHYDTVLGALRGVRTEIKTFKNECKKSVKDQPRHALGGENE